jgi:hypothetical protein
MRNVKALVPFLLLALVSACRRDRIEVRRVPKQDEAPTGMAAAGLPPVPRAKGLVWETPKGWTALPADGLREATLKAPGGNAQVTVIALPGSVGGELANVNRWRGQLALKPIGEKDLPSERRLLRCRAGKIRLYDFTGGGTPATRIVAGTIMRRGTTWFFKLMGDASAVAAARPAFVRMLQGLKSDAR